MSSHSYSDNCHKCNGKDALMVNQSTRPYLSVSGECIECGFSYYTKEIQMELSEVNEMRSDRELPELDKLSS